MEHHFDVKLAQKYGVIEAILLNHFEFWIQQNEANERNFYNGRYWTYNSLKAFCEIFPYLSEKQIRRALNKLQEEGILLVGNFNQNPYDRTLWYSLSEKGNSILPKGQMETAERANVQTAKRANGNCQKGRPIPDINTDINTDKKTSRFIKPTVEQVKAKEFYRAVFPEGSFEREGQGLLSGTQQRRRRRAFCRSLRIQRLAGGKIPDEGLASRRPHMGKEGQR